MRWIWLAAAAGCMEYNPGAAPDVEGITRPDGSGGPKTLPDGWVTETWDLENVGGTVDVLFFGDTSGSMEEELVTMGTHVTRFVDRLATYVPDWQLGVVTGHTGCAVNGVLSPRTPDYAQRFAEAMLTLPPNGDFDETGLANVATALEEAGPGGCNEGLLRGGMLGIVFVSDENDESPGFESDPDYWRTYLDRIVAAHGDANLVVASAVAGPTPFGCTGADPGDGYAEVVAATGGAFLSICEPWEEELDLLADASAVRDTFILEGEPIPGTIEVWMNDIELPKSAWTWVPESNAVVLGEPAIAGDRVEILYQQAQ